MTTVARTVAERRQRAKTDRTRLRLLDAFELVCDGASIPLPMNAQRFIAFLALHERPLLRSYVAGMLWLDTSDERAHANLRSTLWRLQRWNRDLVEVRGQQLRLSAGVDVDVREVASLARQTLDDTSPVALALSPSALTGDVLPDWYDDWVLIEREYFRQLRLRALDALCARLARAGRFAEALEAGLAAVAGEPLRESAHREVIRVHLAEGNACEAVRQYRLCRRLLEEHLGVEPSHQLEELMAGVTSLETIA